MPFLVAGSYCSNSLAFGSPGTPLGTNLHVGMYVSNWSALALSKKLDDASVKHFGVNEFYKYIVHLPNGYIDYDAFCKDLITQGLDRVENDMDAEAIFGPAPYSVSEVFPRGSQKIAAQYIVAAIKYSNERNTSEEEVSYKIILNENSVHFASLKIKFNDEMIDKNKLKCTDKNNLKQKIRAIARHIASDDYDLPHTIKMG